MSWSLVHEFMRVVPSLTVVLPPGLDIICPAVTRRKLVVIYPVAKVGGAPWLLRAEYAIHGVPGICAAACSV